ncbi:MAG: cellulase, partial [Sphingobacteriales bacterium]
MKKITAFLLFVFVACIVYAFKTKEETPSAWIRINQLGYLPASKKAAVWCSKDSISISNWQLIDAATKKIAASGKAGKAFGAYGPFKQSYRLDFSHFTKPGKYYLQAGGVKSPVFEISNDVYKG